LKGYKVSIFLEELRAMYGLEYTLHTIDLMKGEQKEPWFTALNPNGRIPVLVDHDFEDEDGAGPLVMMEGMVILEHLGDKIDVGEFAPSSELKPIVMVYSVNAFISPCLDHHFTFTTPRENNLSRQWLCFAQSHLGPWTNCAVALLRFTPKENQRLPTILHFIAEVERLYGVLNNYLRHRTFLVGGEYSIADIAVFAAVDNAATVGVDLQRWESLHAWWMRIEGREAVRKGCAVPSKNPLIGIGLRESLERNESGCRDAEREVKGGCGEGEEGGWVCL
jgi:glutathione S-transferase